MFFVFNWSGVWLISASTINDLIGWSHRNLRRFHGVNEHCSFSPWNQRRFRSTWILSAGISGQGPVGPVPFDTSCFYPPINRLWYGRDTPRVNRRGTPPISRLVGPLLKPPVWWQSHRCKLWIVNNLPRLLRSGALPGVEPLSPVHTAYGAVRTSPYGDVVIVHVDFYGSVRSHTYTLRRHTAWFVRHVALRCRPSTVMDGNAIMRSDNSQIIP